jgi:hypothetical protein
MDKLSVRRKLLRGSLSAPLVLTVTSAAATGTRSTFGACIDRADGETPSTRLCDQPDLWMRRKLHIKKFTFKSGRSTYSSRFFIDCPAGPNTGKCYELEGDTAPYKLKVTTPQYLPTSYYSRNDKHKQADALCFFDDRGYEVGWHWEENHGSCVAKSCYASVYGKNT